jgi:hypothetical protein
VRRTVPRVVIWLAAILLRLLACAAATRAAHDNQQSLPPANGHCWSDHRACNAHMAATIASMRNEAATYLARFGGCGLAAAPQ